MRKKFSVIGVVSAAWAGFAPALLTAFLLNGGISSGGARFLALLALAACVYAAVSLSAGPRWFFLICVVSCAESALMIAFRHWLPASPRVPVGAWIIEAQADPASAAYSASFGVMALMYLFRSIAGLAAWRQKGSAFASPSRGAAAIHERRRENRIGTACPNGNSDVTFEELERLLKE